MIVIGEKEYRNLQEQVLKNAQDIEALKGIKNLQVVIVEELPEVGNPNYIYLVVKDGGEQPDVYEEYIWLEDEERYEQIGGVTIDLTNYVTLNTAQVISSDKTISKDNYLMFATAAGEGKYFYISSKSSNIIHLGAVGIASSLILDTYLTNFSPDGNTQTLGAPNKKWQHLYLSGNVDFGDNAIIKKDSSNRITIQFNGSDVVNFGSTTYFAASVLPKDSATYDLGSASYMWDNVFVAGNISDGINGVAVVDIAKKTSSTYASGTFDANGESTYDLGFLTPTGLFVFTYGNCQCFLRLTSAMITASSLTPIRISCPMIYNGNPVSGWLEMSKSGSTLTVAVKDSTNHVDSGYSWTLEKLDLL